MNVLDLFRLDGKVAMVTGVRHLGYDIADALAEAGAHLVITARSLETLSPLAEKLRRERGVEVLPMALDQRTHAAVKAAMETAQAWKGRLDILVNNAGGGSGQGPCHLLERQPADAENLIQTNLTGALHCCQEAARFMVKQKSGKIINIASIAGLVGRDRRMYERSNLRGQPIDYAVAKAGMVGMTLDLAGLLGPYGICVNAISPGGFERDDMPRMFVQDYSDRTPLGRMGRDGIDLKGAALFLASPASDYVTGHNLVVDGGFSIWH